MENMLTFGHDLIFNLLSSLAEKVCKANKRVDEKYGTLEFAAAIPGNYSVAK